MQISCKKAGETVGNATTISSVRGWMFGNILLGGFIGVGVDLGTGAGFDYPKTVTVDSDRKFAAFANVATVAGVSQTSITVATISPEPVARGAAVPAVATTVSMRAAVPAVSIPKDKQNTDISAAAELPPAERQVASGVETMVAAHADLARMCSTDGATPLVQVLESARHGTLEIKQGEFIAPGVRASDACPSGKVYGTQIYYRPEPGFHGTDRVRYSVMAATGQFTRTVNIEVE